MSSAIRKDQSTTINCTSVVDEQQTTNTPTVVGDQQKIAATPFVTNLHLLLTKVLPKTAK